MKVLRVAWLACNVSLMETTQTTSPRRNHVAAIVTKDGATFGRVVLRGRDRFEATRSHGVQGVDIRRVSSFRSLAAAVAWIEVAA